jgi:hypothetical protein
VVDSPRQSAREIPSGAGWEHSDQPIQFGPNVLSLGSKEEGRDCLGYPFRSTSLADERRAFADHYPRRRIDSGVDRPSVNTRYSGNRRYLASRPGVSSRTNLGMRAHPAAQIIGRVPAGP